MRIQTSIFRKYDIRGVFPEEVNERTGYLVARAFSKVLDKEKLKIVVGRDGKESSGYVEDGFIKGLVDSGVEVISIGLSSTPMLYWAVSELEADGGAVITASHISDNNHTGIKLVIRDAVPMDYSNGLKEIEELISGDELSFAKKEGEVVQQDILEEYTKELKRRAGSLPKIKVAIDASGGMAGLVLEKLFDGSKVKTTPLYWEIDVDDPPHSTDPTKKENRKELKKAVKKSKSDLGFIYDQDADRFFVVDKEGEVIDPNFVTIVLARHLTEKGDSIVIDVRASDAVVKELEDIKVIRSQSWHPELKKVMRKNDSVFGTERSGHYMLGDMESIDDGVLASIYFLQAVGRLGLKEFYVELESFRSRYFMSPEVNFEVGERDVKKVLGRVEKRFKEEKVDKVDGLTITSDTWRFNIRPSQTEPVMRVNAEAETEERLDELLKEIGETIVN